MGALFATSERNCRAGAFMFALRENVFKKRLKREYFRGFLRKKGVSLLFLTLRKIYVKATRVIFLGL